MTIITIGLIILFIITNIKLFQLKKINENAYIYNNLENLDYPPKEQKTIEYILTAVFSFYLIIHVFNNTYENIWQLVINILHTFVFIIIFDTSIKEISLIYFTEKIIKQINNELISINEYIENTKTNSFENFTNISINDKGLNKYIKYISYNYELDSKNNIIGYILFLPKTIYKIEDIYTYAFIKNIIKKIAKEDSIANKISICDKTYFDYYYKDYKNNFIEKENFIIYEQIRCLNNENNISVIDEILIDNYEKNQLEQILTRINDEDINRTIELIKEYKDTNNEDILDEINYLLENFITDNIIKNDLNKLLEIKEQIKVTEKNLRLIT